MRALVDPRGKDATRTVIAPAEEDRPRTEAPEKSVTSRRDTSLTSSSPRPATVGRASTRAEGPSCPTPTSTPSRPTSTRRTSASPPCATAPGGPPTSPTPPPRRSTRRSPRRTCATDWPASTPTCPASASGASTTRTTTRWYIGRRHVEDARGDAVVVDWRAEVATPFYRATAVDPQGLTPPAPVHDDRAPARRPVRRGVRRPRQRRRGPPRRHPRSAARRARARAHRRDARHRRHHRRRAGPGHPGAARHVPRRPGRAGHRQDGGGAAPGRVPPLRAPGPRSTWRGCSSSGRTRSSCATSPRCCRRSARRPPARPRSSACWPAPRTGWRAPTTTRPTASRATAGWPRSIARAVAAAVRVPDEGLAVTTTWGTARVPHDDVVAAAARRAGQGSGPQRGPGRVPQPARPARAHRPGAPPQRGGGDHRGGRRRPAARPRPGRPRSTGCGPPSARPPWSAGC